MNSTSSTPRLHRRVFPILAANLLLGACLATAASAQVFTTKLSKTAPTERVQISNTAAPGNNGSGQPPGNDSISGDPGTPTERGQTFTVGPTGFKLGAVTIRVAGMQPAGSEAMMTLKILSYASDNTAKPKSTVATFTGKLPALTETELAYYVENPTYLTFNIPPVALVGRGIYGFSLSFVKQGVVGEDINFYVSYGDSFPGGVETIYDGKTYETSVNDLTDFYLQSVP